MTPAMRRPDRQPRLRAPWSARLGSTRSPSTPPSPPARCTTPADRHRDRRSPPMRRVIVSALRLLRALASAATLVALLAGLPWALARFVGWPLPHQIPSLG